MAVIESKPALLRTPWPPKGYLERKEVSAADNWWTLAAEYGRTDPWDLIVYNFGTRDPAEVNWYLKNYVGCTLTKDGKNYSFGRKPGDPPAKCYVYIPHPDWRPMSLNDDLARGLVVRTLMSGAARKTYFVLGPTSITVGEMGKVADYVVHDAIHVRYEPSLGEWAMYEPRAAGKENTLFLAFNTAGRARRALIVHEAIHAAMDIRSSLVNTLESEAAAYVGASIYYYHEGERTKPTSTDTRLNPILSDAWDIGLKKIAGTPVTEAERQELYKKIDAHPKYSGRTYPGYNGV
ncbi:hypothetical protein [Planctellipticum variicoloris]|uniref:hypothetical protein n=1 Tax=Planctellipticum variicoloris TaxID=3064265 RepID=UPI003013ED6C|nr:hypothetical protein SH412_003051 [Planctomycetaceae bacterium SH412]